MANVRGSGAKLKNSRPYTVDGKVYSFTHDRSGKLIGVTSKGSNGKFNVAEDLNQPKFTTDAAQSAISNAYNIANYKGNKESYETFADVSYASIEERSKFLNDNKKKFANQSVVEQEDVTRDRNIATQNASPKGSDKSEVMSYPFDLNPKQDHFKIMRYNYIRPDINMSKGPDQEIARVKGAQANKRKNYGNNQTGDRIINRAGDSVVGSELKGSVLLPMPKATDVNGAEWGKSELTISGIAALGAANMVAGRLANDDGQALAEKEARDALNAERGRNVEGNAGTEFARALGVQTISKLAGFAFGTQLDADTFLARTGGKVLNPNAEMLFQGPVIRDFAFSFIMIARSQEEGQRIRKIIRFLKLGMAPKFRSTTFLKSPDIFTLHYKNGQGKDDYLRTVNQFNPGGLALTTMNVDYAPFGYWSAYRDSQPVSVKMDLNFTELRPLYESDQLETPEDSVGY